ncbi:MAG: hypothetical protein ACPLSJ_01070 [Thermosulfidibacteraceae bacterium]|jgi:hypothetical protein
MIVFKLFDNRVKIKGIKSQVEADEIASILERIIEEQAGPDRKNIVAYKIMNDREILGVVLKLLKDYYKLKLIAKNCEEIIDRVLKKE